ncbi:MAG: hypothetical protein JRH20_13875 [Deltaproteobacteria bacterium]|nr:hypothetical protein [Deltaproteobacteria bacterium]
MGILEGAIIGGGIGLIVSLALLLKRSAGRKKLVTSLANEGREVARERLDATHPALGKVPLSKILQQRERMAGLALVGDVDALREEIQAHDGPLTAHAQVDAIAYLALVVRGEVEEGSQGLEALAARMEQEGGRGLMLVKRKVRALAELAKAVAGTPLIPAQRLRVESVAGEGGLVQLLVWQALGLALRAEGKVAQADGMANKVRRVTRAYEGEGSP